MEGDREIREFCFWNSPTHQNSDDNLGSSSDVYADLAGAHSLLYDDGPMNNNAVLYVADPEDHILEQVPVLNQEEQPEIVDYSGSEVCSTLDANVTAANDAWPGRTLKEMPSRSTLIEWLRNPDNDVVVSARPMNIPTSEGVYICCIRSTIVSHPADIFRDGLTPWNSQHSRQHTRYYESQPPHSRVYKKSDVKGSHVIFTEGKHPEHPLYRKVCSLRHDTDSSNPPADSYYCIIYHVLNSFDYECTLPRMYPSTSKNLRSLLQHTTPMKAFQKHLENSGGLLNLTPEKHVNIGAVRSLAKRTPNRDPGLARVNAVDDASVITELIKENHPFLKSRLITADDDRIFFASNAMLELARNSMLPLQLVTRMNDAIEKICKQPFDITTLSKFVSSDEYQRWKRCGVMYIDTTFDMSSYNVTVAYASVNNFITKKTGQPTFAVAAIMLSKSKSGEAYRWFGDTLCKLIRPAEKKTFRAVCTDQDFGLDAFSDNALFKTEVKLHCAEHASRNWESLARGDRSIKKVLFGQTSAECQQHVAGIFDRTEFNDFSDRLCRYGKSLSDTHPEVSARLMDESKHIQWFTRFGLPSRLKGGFGFDFTTTNSIEGWNQTVKVELTGRQSIQTLIPELVKHSERAFTVLASAVYSSNTADTITVRPGMQKPSEAQWVLMSKSAKIDILKRFGLCHLEEFPSFAKEYYQIEIPLQLHGGMTLDAQLRMTQAAKEMDVQSIGGQYAVVNSKSNVFVSSKSGRFICQCNNSVLICPHILAIHYKYPGSNIFDKQMEYLQHESEAEHAKRTFKRSDGSKPGSRRHGASPSRNMTVYPDSLIDADWPQVASSSMTAPRTCKVPPQSKQGFPSGKRGFSGSCEVETTAKKARTEDPVAPPLHFNNFPFEVIASQSEDRKQNGWQIGFAIEMNGVGVDHVVGGGVGADADADSDSDGYEGLGDGSDAEDHIRVGY